MIKTTNPSNKKELTKRSPANGTGAKVVASSLLCPEDYPGVCPLAVSRVQAGFPSPADDYLDQPLNLNTYLIDNPSATFFVRAGGDSMTGAGIFPNDLLIVDRSLTPETGNVVIAVVEGEFTVKRFVRLPHSIELHPENPVYPPLRFRSGSDLEIWGVVKHVIHSL